MKVLVAKVGFVEPEQLMVPATAAFVGASLLAAIVRLANLWLNGWLAAAIGSDISAEVYKRTLYQPYLVHVQRNSSTVINTIGFQVGRAVGALNSSLQISTAVIVATSLLIGLLLIDWKVALASAGIFGTAYGLIAIISRRKLKRNSSLIAVASRQVVKAVQEALGAIRDVLLDGSQPFYQKTYIESDRLQRQLQAKSEFLLTYPRYVLEAIGMIAIAFLAWLLVLQNGNGSSVIPLLGALALGAQRLLPALQQTYSAWASLKGYSADLACVIDLLEQQMPQVLQSAKPLELRQCIKLQDVSFKYGPNLPEVLKGINLEIKRGERIGLVGETGSGKSTLIDLLIGLLEPSRGKLIVDGLDLHDSAHPERLVAWRASIAHVPQNIYLSDASIAENIGFGIDKRNISLDRVKAAAVDAQLSSFIDQTPDGYNTCVGERGICLSGGQRQRIGIARALYKRARILVFDEATSALDNETEKSLMESINCLSKNLTLIMIAHRLSTLRNCDRIIQL